MKHPIPEGQCVETRYGFAYNGLLDIERCASSSTAGREWACIRVYCADGTCIEIQASRRKHHVKEIVPPRKRKAVQR